MIHPNITDDEKRIIRILAKLFNDGNNPLVRTFEAIQAEWPELDRKKFECLMKMTQSYGGIEQATHAMGEHGQYIMFSISPIAVQMARELDDLEQQAKEPGDIVGQINEKVRSKPILAWILITFLVLTAAATFINQTIQIFQNLGWVAKP